MYILLRLGCTLHVTSCENERANSALKKLKSFVLSTMGQEQLYVHYDLQVDLDDVVYRFKLKCNR